MGKKRKQAADYAADQPDSLETTGSLETRVKQLNVCAALRGTDSMQSALKRPLEANDTSFKGGGRT